MSNANKKKKKSHFFSHALFLFHHWITVKVDKQKIRSIWVVTQQTIFNNTSVVITSTKLGNFCSVFIGRQIMTHQPNTICEIKNFDWSKKDQQKHRKKSDHQQEGHDTDFQHSDNEGTAKSILIFFLYLCRQRMV